MASNTNTRNAKVTLLHPLAADTCIHPGNIRDALNNCVSTLYLLSGHFNSEEADYNLFDSVFVRRGMSLQLQAITDTLEAIEACLGNEAEKTSAEREAEREAEWETRRKVEERIAADPETIAKQIALSKAFAEACNLVLFDRKRETPQPADPQK